MSEPFETNLTMAVERGGTNQLLDILERVADGGVQVAEIDWIPAPPLRDDMRNGEGVASQSSDPPGAHARTEP